MSRQESIEEVLKVAAQNGETAKLVSLLERGAPFVVDMVRDFTILQHIFSISFLKGKTKI